MNFYLNKIPVKVAKVRRAFKLPEICHNILSRRKFKELTWSIKKMLFHSGICDIHRALTVRQTKILINKNEAILFTWMIALVCLITASISFKNIKHHA